MLQLETFFLFFGRKCQVHHWNLSFNFILKWSSFSAFTVFDRLAIGRFNLNRIQWIGFIHRKIVSSRTLSLFEHCLMSAPLSPYRRMIHNQSDAQLSSKQVWTPYTMRATAIWPTSHRRNSHCEFHSALRAVMHPNRDRHCSVAIISFLFECQMYSHPIRAPLVSGCPLRNRTVVVARQREQAQTKLPFSFSLSLSRKEHTTSLCASFDCASVFVKSTSSSHSANHDPTRIYGSAFN